MTHVAPEAERSSFDEQYWLGHCEGFRVTGSDGFAGVVQEVRFGPDRQRPEELVVCSGRLRLRSVLVPADEVALVVPRQMRLRLRHAPAVSEVPERSRSRQVRPWEVARGVRT